MKTKYDEVGPFAPSDSVSTTVPVESEISIMRADEKNALGDSGHISAAARGTIRILIVDDDRTLREGSASPPLIGENA